MKSLYSGEDSIFFFEFVWIVKRVAANIHEFTEATGNGKAAELGLRIEELRRKALDGMIDSHRKGMLEF